MVAIRERELLLASAEELIPYQHEAVDLFDEEKLFPEYGLDLIIDQIESLPQELLIKILTENREVLIPERIDYEPILDAPEIPGKHVVMSIGGHPTDLWDFEGATIAELKSNNNDISIIELMATRGEKGAPQLELSEDKVIEIREKESKISAQILGHTMEYLQTPDGSYFPDGELLNHLTQLKDSIKEKIWKYKPDIIFLHAPELDHVDHVATYYASIRALRELAEEKREEFKKPTVYLRDPEFLFASAEPESFEKLNEVLRDWSSGRRENQIQAYPKRPEFVTNDFVIEMTRKSKQKKIAAMAALKTQMLQTKREMKGYAYKLPARSLIRGKVTKSGEKASAEGFRKFHSDYTSSENRLASYLPRGTMFQQKRVA